MTAQNPLDNDPGPEPTLFSAIITPHRSLSGTGFLVVMGLVGGLSFIGGTVFFLLGAWPVAGFMGIDVWLLWFFFQRSYLDARRRETLTLTDRELIVERRSPDGEREEHRLDAYWLRFDVSEERLVVVSRGNRIVVGRFLSPEERGQLAEELKAAHARMRAPRTRMPFDVSSTLRSAWFAISTMKRSPFLSKRISCGRLNAACNAGCLKTTRK